MEQKLNKIEAAIIIVVVLIAFVGWVTYGVFNKEKDEKISQLEARLDILEADRGQKQLNIDNYKKKITGLNQEVEQLTIKYMADEMYIEELESEYKIVLTYATVAESLLQAAGIDYTILQGIEDEEKN